MASNNRKSSQRWSSKSSDDRTRHSTRAQQSGGSLHGKRKVDSKKVQETLDDMFRNVFDGEIIRSVAHSCGWDLSRSIETLIMLSEGEDSSGMKLQKISGKGSLPLAVNKYKAKDKSPELSKRNVPDNSSKSVLIPSDSRLVGTCSKSANTSKTKSVMMNTSQGPIKVLYKGHDDPEISDEDVDVVIEEENEIEDNSVEFTFANFSSQSMCQFLTHLIPPLGAPVDYNPELKSHEANNLSVNNKSTDSSSNTSTPVRQCEIPARKTKHWPQFERIKKQINDSIKVMVLLRGVPGSGKTSLARHIIKVTHGENYEKYVFSTDHYFVVIGKGKYVFDPKLLPDAHKWNQHRVYVEARNGTSPLLIDNTNLESWEMEPYVEIAVDCGYNIELLEPKTSWRYNPIELEKKNIHNVSQRKIQDMLLRFERDLTPGKLMTYFNLQYKANNSPPQFTPQKNMSMIQKEFSVSNLKKKSKLKKEEEENNSILTKDKKLDVKNPPINVDANEENISSCPEVFQSNNTISDDSMLKELEPKGTNTELMLPGNECSLFHETDSDEHLTDPNYEVSDEQKVYEVVSDNSENKTQNVESNNEVKSTSNIGLPVSNLSVNDVLGSTPQEINVKCTNYVLVMKDGTLLPQKSYTESFDSSNCSQASTRKWEYVLMADDSHLLFNSTKVSLNSNLHSDPEYKAEQSQLKSPEKTSFVQSCCIELPCDDVLDKTSSHSDGMNDSFQDSNNKFQLLDLSETPVNIVFTNIDDTASLIALDNFVLDNKVDLSKSAENVEKISETTLNTLVSSGKNQVNFDDLNPKDTIKAPFQISESDTSDQAFESGEQECDSNNTDKPTVSPSNQSENIVQPEGLLGNAKLIHIDRSEKEPNNHNVDPIGIAMHATTLHSRESQSVIHQEPGLLEQQMKVQNENVKDILTLWNEGSSWDDQEHKVSESIKQSAFLPTPKPARLINKHPISSTASEKIIVEHTEDKVLETSNSGIWSAVDEPLESWEVIVKERKDLLNENIVTKARPQREQFASMKQSETQVLTELEISENSSGVVCDTSFGKCLSDDTPSNLADTSNGIDINELPSDVLKVENVVAIDALKSNESLASTSCDIFGGVSETSKLSKHGVHTSTNTCHLDFMVLNSVNLGVKITDEGYVVLDTSPRDIIETDQVVHAHTHRKIFPVLLLDKSSMTSHDCFDTEVENTEEQLKELIHMFPNCTVEDLQEIFEKCNKDINWTVDLLLESASQGVIISTLSNSCGTENTHLNVDSAAVNDDVSNTSIQIVGNESNSAVASSPVSETPDSTHHTTLTHDLKCISEPNSKTLSSSKRNGKKDRNAPLSEESLLLKKQLEENIVINDEHYSEHVSRIRKLRHGEIGDMTDVSPSLGDLSESNFMQDIEEEVNSSSAADTTQGSLQVLCPDALEWEGAGVSQDVLEEEEFVSLQLDTEMADQLHNLFGTATLSFSQAGMKPCLNLPISLARQLHYYMLEAEQNSYDLMMQEDEDLARKLQLQEEIGSEVSLSSTNAVPDLREIMDMEMALALYKADQNSPENDDFATKLTKDLLCEWFPSLPRDVLINVFEAHHGSFEETIEVLIASTEEDNCVRTVMTPEARAAHERALLQKANLECEKSKENLLEQPVNGEKTTQEKALEDAHYYRSEASRHYKLRNECQQKAQKTFQKGLTAVAAYYSQMASLHKERIEENNAKAASSLLLAHSLGNLTTTLDLHFLYVVEALQVLDMFLDHHVNQLLESGHRFEHLFVITGRGARSTGGRSRIKPAVIQRLEQRGLRHVEVNPGLLKVTITRNTTSSTRIAS